MTAQKRPRRKNKADRLTYSGASASEIKCDYAVAPLDRLALAMDRKWGIDRLPELVSVETAQKYGSAMAKLNAAMEADDPAEVARRAQVCMRGLAAMNQEAEAAGHSAEPGDVWEFDLDGFKFGIVQDITDQARVMDRRPDLRLFTMREAAQALKAYAGSVLVDAVKKNFPDAEISKLPDIKLPPEFWERGDHIPF